MLTVLVVDSQPSGRASMRAHVEKAGFRALHTRLGEDVVPLVTAHSPALVVLDTDLAGIDGFEAVRRLRAAGDWTPVLFCSERDAEVDVVLALESGADDYVVRPYSRRVLDARMAALVRRGVVQGMSPSDAHHQPGPAVMRHREVVVDIPRHRVTVAGEVVELSAREFDLLAYLMARPGRVVGRTQLLRDVWGASGRGQQRTVDVHVAQVRAKLGTAGDVIRTYRGVGYGAPEADTSAEPGPDNSGEQDGTAHHPL